MMHDKKGRDSSTKRSRDDITIFRRTSNDNEMHQAPCTNNKVQRTCTMASFMMKPLPTFLSLFLLLSSSLMSVSCTCSSSSPLDQRQRSWLEPKRSTVTVRERVRVRVRVPASVSYPAVFKADWVKKGAVPQQHEDVRALVVTVNRKSQSSYADPMNTYLAANPNPTSTSTSTLTFQETPRRPTAWPPWPLSLLTPPSRSSSSSQESAFFDDAPYRSTLSRMSSFTRQCARVSFKNLQTVGVQLWFHLPPAAAPFLTLAIIPQNHRVVLASGEVVMKRAAPLIVNPFARKLALASFGLAIMSWGHYELNTRRKQTPLPLIKKYQNLNWAILPPFLPQQVTIDVMEQVRHEQEQEKKKESLKETITEEDDMPVTMLKTLVNFWEGAAGPMTLRASVREWRRMRDYRNRERLNAHRLAVMDELVALQTLKKERAARTSRRKQGNGNGNGNGTRNGNGNGNGNGHDKYRNRAESRNAAAPDKTDDDLGYALVTGASRGIGRAIAVELARWEIPLILVARDVERLTSLAYDLEACYGVKCCVLPADLSKPGAAERLYKITQDAGLKVDILINNAGFALHGEAVDQNLDDVNDMIQVNAMSVSSLTHLYGRDMKRRRRGRIMMVSSICGAVAGLPTVAAYAATKAFENVLGVSMAKEMEPYGVGVFCLVPGAVKDTDFKSVASDALCWKLPFYCKTPPQVAEVGVKLMLRGDTQFTVGWQNRVFTKVLRPALPPRLHNIIAEAAFNPLRSPFARLKQIAEEKAKENEKAPPSSSNPSPAQLPPDRPYFGLNEAPRLLQFQEPKTVEEETEDPAEFSIPRLAPAADEGSSSDVDSTRAEAGTRTSETKTTTTTTKSPALVPEGQASTSETKTTTTTTKRPALVPAGQ